ncbi:glycosyltransferase family 4 protein [Leucobacter massiliensis]|uniref:D-inositol 3-phosphate glycosyltransferase n=1 Tax=Leucobacter massiliensis TaxID=1686285 RepID=A0A2S9QKV0_9MICO|nr:glycosyltransferase family 4 protein [Leucobacter massiliensis]PRI10209.1 group 1 glycosyl transferase [Leucobacter massiliensis]
MRIAFVVNNYPPRTGGVELHVRSLAAELALRGHRVLVVTLGETPGWSRDDRVEVLTLPEHFRIANILGFPGPGTRRRLTRLLRERGVEAVSVHTRFFPMSFVGWRAARRAGIPVIHTEHGSDHVASDSRIIGLASRAVDVTLGRAVLRGADRVLGVSREVTEFVRRLAGVEATVFPNAIEVRAAEDPDEQITDRPGHLVFVGRLVPGKGWEAFLEVVAACRAAGRDTTGEVLGDGADMPRLRERLAALGLGGAVAVRGRVPQSEVRRALRGATLINPTTLSEGFQTTLLEAIAESGRVVTYPVPGAETLRAEGANVVITSGRDPAELAAATLRLLGAPGDPAPRGFIDAWSWAARAVQFERECAALPSAATPEPPAGSR